MKKLHDKYDKVIHIRLPESEYTAFFNLCNVLYTNPSTFLRSYIDSIILKEKKEGGKLANQKTNINH